MLPMRLPRLSIEPGICSLWMDVGTVFPHRRRLIMVRRSLEMFFEGVISAPMTLIQVCHAPDFLLEMESPSCGPRTSTGHLMPQRYPRLHN